MKVERLNIGRVALLKHLPQGGTCAEVGVLLGKFSNQILLRNEPKRLYLIDAWVHIPPEQSASMGDDTASQKKHDERYELVRAKFSGDKRVKIMRGMSVPMLRKLPKKHLDWAFIDGSHTEEGVLADLLAVRPRMKQDGLIVGHDFVAVHRKNRQSYGIIQAVDRFLHKYPQWGLLFITREKHATYVLCRNKSKVAKDLRKELIV